MKAKPIRFLWTIALFAAALHARPAAAAVTVYGEASSTGPTVTVQVFADISKTPLLSFGVRVLYDPQSLYVGSAAQNTALWYFSNPTGQLPYMSPDTSKPGEVFILGGRLDSLNPLQGVTGTHVLLGTVVFGRWNNNALRFSVALGRDAPFANFVGTDGTVFDTGAGAVVFNAVQPDPADTDLDGLPDGWETQHFGSISRYTWSDDPDGDGVNNRSEYVADTIPTAKTSYLRIVGASPTRGGVKIDWQGGIQATQYLQRSATLGGQDAWVDIYTNQPPTAIAGSYTDMTGAATTLFYRLRATR